jgi:type IV secretory pathway TraG/TraD family ATPase VirD4
LRVAAPTPGSVLVVGPTQSGKTTSLCVPMVLRWEGPVLAASVKPDLARLTSEGRAARGRVQLVDPGGAGDAVFDPVALATSYAAARAIARDLTVGTGAGHGAGEHEFWGSLAAKLLAPLLLAAHRVDGSIATVSCWVDRHDAATALGVLEGHEDEAADALAASLARDDRTLSAVLATVEAALDPLVAGEDVVDPEALLDGPNTCYLAAPVHDQRRFRPLFVGLVRQVLAAAARRDGGAGLLVLLDEAASIAPLDELDEIAATCQGQGVTLVTVWQDLAQLVARYGPRARTVVNNHTSRVLLGGLADPTLGEWLPTLTGPASETTGRTGAAPLSPEQLRQWPRGAAVLVAGRHPPLRLRLSARPGSLAPHSLRSRRGRPVGSPLSRRSRAASPRKVRCRGGDLER